MYFLCLQIGSNTLVTAAHCVQDENGIQQTASQLTVYLGVLNRGDVWHDEGFERSTEAESNSKFRLHDMDDS